MTDFCESTVEDAALAWLDSLGYTVLHGPNIAAGESAAARQDYIWLRNTQLHKLISGELRVRDAERIAGIV